MKFRVVLYTLIAVAIQVALGWITGQGQGGIGMLIFLVIIELDPKFRFSYLITKKNKTEK